MGAGVTCERCKELEKQVRELNELIVRMVEAQARAVAIVESGGIPIK